MNSKNDEDEMMVFLNLKNYIHPYYSLSILKLDKFQTWWEKHGVCRF